MLTDTAALLADKLSGMMWSLLPITLGMAAAYTALAFFSSQACNPGKPWWRNRGLTTDAIYWFIVPFIGPYIRTALMVSFAAIAMRFVTADDLSDYLTHGRGPLGGLALWVQGALYLLASDFLLYWIHRLFHGAQLWPYHAVHHSAEDVDWTTAYRSHPVNLCFGMFFVDVVMLFAGVSPTVMMALAPWQTISATFVHANLNWTLGPLKYVIATPVFHHWHHTLPDEGGERNFAPTFSFWDVLFGTFYMPEGKLPERYGVDDPQFPAGFFGQLAYPFLRKKPEKAAVIAPAALGSVGPQPRS
jgi:sterol desaturase/sphingolipid hydroxylase (fatty acid hydroxylase superfamily)